MQPNHVKKPKLDEQRKDNWLESFGFFFINLFDLGLGLWWSLHSWYLKWVGLSPLPGTPNPLCPHVGGCTVDEPYSPDRPLSSLQALFGEVRCTHSPLGCSWM